MSNRRGIVPRIGRAVGVLGLATGTVAGGLLASAGVAQAAPARSYEFTTLNNSNDLTFNQLLGINNHRVIAGYFGSGAAGHPNKGYYLLPGRSQLDYRIENFPASVQTQATGLNDGTTQVGFYAPSNTGTDTNYAWYSLDNGRTFHSLHVRNVTLGNTPVTQLLGVNDANKVVGFYTDAQGNNHGFSYTLTTHVWVFTTIPGATSLTETSISNRGHITGFFTAAGGSVQSFLKDNAAARLHDRGRPAWHWHHHDQWRQRPRRPGRLLHRLLGQRRRHVGRRRLATSYRPVLLGAGRPRPHRCGLGLLARSRLRPGRGRQATRRRAAAAILSAFGYSGFSSAAL